MTENSRVDLTRLNRKDRRRIGKRARGKILGRNLPFSRAAYGTLKNFNELREKEIAKENGN